MYLNQIKVKPGNYADSFNVWIPNIAEFIKELEHNQERKRRVYFLHQQKQVIR
jgi:hypothetical protein